MLAVMSGGGVTIERRKQREMWRGFGLHSNPQPHFLVESSRKECFLNTMNSADSGGNQEEDRHHGRSGCGRGFVSLVAETAVRGGMTLFDWTGVGCGLRVWSPRGSAGTGPLLRYRCR